MRISNKRSLNKVFLNLLDASSGYTDIHAALLMSGTVDASQKDELVQTPFLILVSVTFPHTMQGYLILKNPKVKSKTRL